MGSRNWMDYMFDDDPKDTGKSFSDKENAIIRDFLWRTEKWEQGKKPDDKGKTLKKEYVKLGAPNGKQILDALMGLKGEDLINALCGAGALGRLLEETEGFTLFALSIVIAFFSNYVPPKVIRIAVGMCRLLFYKKGARKTESFAKRLGTRPKRINRALVEIKEDGLPKPGSEGNAPGSGRPSFRKSFAAVMTGFLLAITGCDEATLEKECSNRRIMHLQSAPDPDNKELIADIATVASITTAFNELKAVAAEVYAEIDKALETTDRAQAVILAMIKETILSATTEIGKEIDYVVTLEGIGQEGEADSNSGDTKASSDKKSAHDADYLRVQILPRVLCPIISLLTERCNAILEAFKETEGMNGYQVAKAAKRKAKLKSLVNSLDFFWEDYRLTLHDLEVMEAENSSDDGDTHEESEAEQKERYDVKSVDVQGLLATVLGNLDILVGKLASAGNAGSARVKKALSLLEKLKELLGSDDIQTLLSLGDQGVPYVLVPAFCFLNNSCQHWLACWEEDCGDTQGARKAADSILSKGFEWGLVFFIEQMNLLVAQQEKSASSSTREGDGPTEGKADGPDGVDEDPLKRSREEAETACRYAADVVKVLMQNLGLSLSVRKERKNSKESRIPKALEFLGTISQQLEKEMASLEEQENIYACQALMSLAAWITAFLEGRLLKWEKDDSGKCVINFSKADRIAGSLCTKGSEAHLKAAWEQLEQIKDGTLKPNAEGEYIGVEKAGVQAEWFGPGAVLSPEERCDLVRKLWNQGKDPRNVETWIEYIISKEFAHYGDPSDREKCCRITRTELLAAFQYLTGMSCSDETLWTILTKVMGYTGRECVKYDQVGEASVHRDEQFKHMQMKVEKANKHRTLVISIDTKAFLLLGRLKHDNGKIMCRKDGRVYRVLDHDFALKLRQIYPHGTLLVDPSRLDENAILHPVGAYCPTDGTGYVALVLGKDTAESVCNLLRMVIDIKRNTTMPDLDSVLIMADGGGSNMANGVFWQAELLRLADDKDVTLDVMHFTAGTSKHNPIEHRLFSALSNHWKGRPFIDIEHVLGYVNATRNKSLTVQGWFDTRRYLTNKEKKAKGMKVLTRAELDKLAGDRITHEFPDGEMYKLNYVVRPSADKKATA